MIAALANHLWQSTLCAALAGLLVLGLAKDCARVRYWVWLGASWKFGVPLCLLMSLGGQFGWRTATTDASQEHLSVVKQVAQPFVTQPPLLIVPASVPVAAHPLTGVLAALWSCGCLGVCASWTRRWRRIRTAVQSASPVPLDVGIPVFSVPALVEPAVFGIFRPILLLPESIGDALSPEQLNAIIAHELCHIRRRDNLGAAVHMAVEAVFWFHPLVWWIGARLVEERERACDEEVLGMGHHPQGYAEGILKICELHLEAPLACTAGVAGSDLTKRIEAIMTTQVGLNLNRFKQFVLAAAGIAAIAGPIWFGLVSASPTPAQSKAARSPSFEVASIRPNPVPGPISMVPRREGSQVVLNNTYLSLLIQYAYQVIPRQVSGAERLPTGTYAIEAKTDASATDADVRLMFQMLLRDRFKLVVHRETKQLPVYNLVVGKGGAKLKPTSPGSQSRLFTSLIRPNMLQLVGQNTTVKLLAEELSRSLDRPVIDRTGIQGEYSFQMEWHRSPDVPSDPSAFTVIQEQLGLKLESGNGPIEILVIDRAERPSED